MMSRPLFRDIIFREYDIRGVVGTDFDVDLAHALGRAFAEAVAEERSGESPLRLAVGYDCRLTSDRLRQALIDGITSGGVDVLDTGMGPTPQLYYAVLTRDTSGGIQVTGSHNPPDQNGFKMMIGSRTLSGPDIQRLKERVKLIAERVPSPARRVGAVTAAPIRDAYIAELISRSRNFVSPQRKLKIVVDAGNGVGGLVGPPVLRALGCDVIELFTEPDGHFPNHHPDPTVLENIQLLRETVRRESADFGIGWDGDADRIGVVDERGEPLFGDMLLIIFGRQLLKELERPIIIGDVKCSELLFSDLRRRGAETVMWRTGHSLIKAKLKELHAALAGEMSGHIFFAHRYFGFDDALHASARLVEILSHSAGTMSDLLADLPKMASTPEIRMECPESIKFAMAERAKSLFPEFAVNTIDGVRITFPHGWGLVRASNTQPVLVLRFEAETPTLLAEYQGLVEGRVRDLQRELSAQPGGETFF